MFYYHWLYYTCYTRNPLYYTHYTTVPAALIDIPVMITR